jgi:broad specificity phosphatase PhoE
MTSGELYLLRHAEADGDDDADPGLSSRGLTQARLVGSRLAGTRAAALLHSPRRRAAETAAIVAESLPDIPVSASDLLDDRTPVPSSMRRNEYPQRYLPRLDQTPQAERDVDGTALSRAVDDLAREAVRAAEHGPLILVTHAFVIGWFVRAALDAPTWRWLGLHPTNTSLTVVRYSAGGTSSLVTFNDDAHLRQRQLGR